MRAAAWYSRADMTAESSSGAGSPLGLSARLLVLTIGFVMLSEVLIYAPSIARFRTVYLEEHIAEAHLATLALDENYGVTPTRMLEREFLARVGAYGIVLRHPERKVLMLSDDMPPMAEVAFDLRDDSWLTMLLDAFAALGQTENRVMRVMGVAPHASGVLVEVVMDEAPMVEEMYAYSGRILSLSIVISLLTAVLVYFSLQWLMVRPMTRIIDSITAFRQDPEEAGPVIAPSGRGDEIGIAERELEAMQQALRASLRQKTRLATLGAAVAKINHDLRNSLATAVLVSDRLADIDDPEVKRVTPRLYEAIDRAVRLCGQTLSFVSDSGADVATTPVRLRALVDDVGEAVRAAARPELTWENLVAEDLGGGSGPGTAVPGADQSGYQRRRGQGLQSRNPGPDRGSVPPPRHGRQRPRPGAESAGEAVSTLCQFGPQRGHRPGPGDRARYHQVPRRRSGSAAHRRRRYDLQPPVARGAPGSASGMTDG